MNYIDESLSILVNTPMEARIGSYMDQIETIWYEIKKLAESYGKGERE